MLEENAKRLRVSATYPTDSIHHILMRLSEDWKTEWPDVRKFFEDPRKRGTDWWSHCKTPSDPNTSPVEDRMGLHAHFLNVFGYNLDDEWWTTNEQLIRANISHRSDATHEPTKEQCLIALYRSTLGMQ